MAKIGRPRKELDLAFILRMRRWGMSYRKIGKAFRVSAATIHHRVQEYNREAARPDKDGMSPRGREPDQDPKY